MTLANDYFPYADSRNAEAVTSTGQAAIKFIEKRLDVFMNKIVGTSGVEYSAASDTDSVYLTFGPLVDKYFSGKTDEEITNLLDKIAKEKVQPYINEAYNELADYMNAFAMEWFMKREAIASSAVFVQKKRYFMHILDDEGVRMKTPKLKVTGLEAIRSSTPEVCRKALKSIMSTILDKDEEDVQKEVERFKKQFFKAPVLDISSPRSVSDLEKWITDTNLGFKSGTPIGVRGAIVFNNLMKKADPLYDMIKSGDKIKMLYLKLPNSFKSNTISLPNDIPDTLKLDEKMVDRELQFEKTYITPLEAMLKVLSWNSKKTNNLSSFFG